MIIQHNMVILEDSTGFSPSMFGVDYTDTSGVRVHIPYTLLVRLYEGCKYTKEKNGEDWEKFCNELYVKEIK